MVLRRKREKVAGDLWRCRWDSDEELVYMFTK
jgi:hypothetical protein